MFWKRNFNHSFSFSVASCTSSTRLSSLLVSFSTSLRSTKDAPSPPFSWLTCSSPEWSPSTFEFICSILSLSFLSLMRNLTRVVSSAGTLCRDCFALLPKLPDHNIVFIVFLSTLLNSPNTAICLRHLLRKSCLYILKFGTAWPKSRYSIITYQTSGPRLEESIKDLPWCFLSSER